MAQAVGIAKGTARGIATGIASTSAAAVSTYLGLVATGVATPSAQNTTVNIKQLTRKAHHNRTGAAITSLQLVYPNWFVSIATDILGAEVANGNAISVTASIEYPASTFTAVTFSGSGSATIADFANAISDAVSVSIPAGEQFWTRTLVTGSGGNNFPRCSNSTNGSVLFYTGTGFDEASQAQTSAMTINQAVTDNQSGKTGYFPIAIIGQTSVYSFSLLGDSRVKGINDIADASHDLGELARSVGPSYPYMNLGIGSDRHDAYLWGGTKRQALIDTYCTTAKGVIVNQYAYNSFGNGAGKVPVVEGYHKMMAPRFTGKRYFLCTLAPHTTSSDSWATTANQSTSTETTNVNTYNTDVMAGSVVSGVTGIDIATPILSAAGSGKWIVNGAANYATSDGVHESQAANLLIQASGNLNPATLAAASPITASYPALTLTAIGSPSYTTGKFGQALSNGAQGFFKGIVPGIPPLTLECWYKGSSAVAQQFLLSSGPISLVASVTDGFIGYFTAGTGAIFSTTSITDNAWHHIAIVCRQSGGAIEIYLDGVSVQTATRSRSLTNWLNNAQSFGVGYTAQTADTGTSPCLGLLDEVAMWSIEKYTTGFTPPSTPYVGNEAGLVAVWHLDGDLTGTRGPTGM